MGMMNTYQARINGIVPNFRITEKNESPEKLSPEYSVLFYGSHDNHCVGFVDMVNSTKISATLTDAKLCKYYSTFLNSAAATIKRFGGILVKNVGDSLLYYFPQVLNSKNDQSFINCLECSLALIEIRDSINEHLATENFPELSYRVSADYGKVMFAESESSYCVDIFGPPVNMCTKINYKATPNTIVLGGDLYEMVKKYNQYTFQKTSEYNLGFKNSYPIYTIVRNKKVKEMTISGISSQYGESNVRSVQVGFAIKRVLSRMGNGELDAITSSLEKKYSSSLFDCYAYPYQLKNILKETYGESYLTIIDLIESECGEFAKQKSYRDFLSMLRNNV